MYILFQIILKCLIFQIFEFSRQKFNFAHNVVKRDILEIFMLTCRTCQSYFTVFIKTSTDDVMQ